MTRRWELKRWIIFGVFTLLLSCFLCEATQMPWPPENTYIEKITQTDLLVYGNLSQIVVTFEDPEKHSGQIRTLANLRILDILHQSNTTPVHIGDTIPVLRNGGSIGNQTSWRGNKAELRDGEGPYPAQIYSLVLDKENPFHMNRYYFLSADLGKSYDEVKSDIMNLQSGEITVSQILDREKKKREYWMKNL